MNIGVVGLGKLGMPVAVAIAMRGHDVMGYDIDPERMSKKPWPFMERGIGNQSFDDLLRDVSLNFGELADVANHADIIFVCVQTPHAERYEGITRLPAMRKDFDYSYLIHALGQIRMVARNNEKIVSIISTCIPGTIDSRIVPMMPKWLHLAHTPFFEAMGQVVTDFLNREFVLIGTQSDYAAEQLSEFFESITDAPQTQTGIVNAEAIKVFYNTFTTSKIVFANTVMESCDKVGADCDTVLNTLQMADQRLISTAYLDGGMGDGGPCHPRDNIALSAFARRHDLSFDLFGSLIEAREAQAEWLCRLMCKYDLPKFILGTAYKADINQEIGSSALLCKSILEEWGHAVKVFDPIVDRGKPPTEPHVFLIGVNHAEFHGYGFLDGSVVIDPWGIIHDRGNITLVKVGRD